MDEIFIPSCKAAADKKELTMMNPLVLAFVGDGVHTLYVRTRLSLTLKEKSGSLHQKAVPELKAAGQAGAMKNILPLLTEEETGVYKRARNAKTPSMAKNARSGDYHAASGFEAILGFLYLAGDTARLGALLNAAYPQIEINGIRNEESGIHNGDEK